MVGLAGPHGGEVRPDARPSYSVYANTFRKAGVPNLLGMSADRMIRFLRSYEVFNADEISGLPDYYYPQPVAPTPRLLSDRQERIDAFFAGIPSRVRHGGSAAFFDISFDYIQMPRLGSFKSADGYASILAHESCHWTGHRTRLDRTFGKKFGDKAYAMEELVAELGAAMICGDLGLPTEMHDTHASYLASWLKVLKADKTAIFLAATKAEQAFSYLRAFSTDAAAAPQARLLGADAFEKRQLCRNTESCWPCGKAGQDYASKLLKAGSSSIRLTGKQSYGRPIGTIEIDGQDLGESMIAAGLAVPATSYLSR